MYESIVYSILRRAHGPATWKELKSIADRDHLHLSTATLSRHLKAFVEQGLVKKYVTKEGKRRYPMAYYALPDQLPPLIPELFDMQLPPWEDKQANEAYDTLLLAMFSFISHLESAIDRACERGSITKARSHANLAVDTELRAHISDLVKLFFRYKDLSVGNNKVRFYVGLEFANDDIAEEWFAKYAPRWAKPYAKYIPEEWLASIIIFNEKEEAQKEILELLEHLRRPSTPNRNQ